ncbi:FAD-dependent oxidoreductase [Actinocrispum wychmicini]|uniref:Flavin-dependent monooxygenase n=1 Tax=Actinocrispum wychmicini TaxID=1213861 RepID=A0A4R2IMY3_9PSEU|nr:NAD(P)/FAD-dependent oxidoreductase [Actinocrispum wychmicini]TCO45358.1 2-polyprenyl-6-methoxyphenol hydroxylase-like FAD-dependent oxidoreductase [Actinocrispum wychmicini]
MDNTTRIAVVGAGLGGLACARGLQLHGKPVTVFERELSRDVRWQGGTLDLHADTGQAAMRAAGLYDRFHALARPEGQEQRALDPITAEIVRHDQPTETDDYAPEIDRGQLRDVFLDSLTEGTVQWGRAVTGVTSLGDGTSSLAFADGTTLDFDLVIGADGAWSRIRPAVSDAVPAYSGITFVETYLDDVDSRHPILARLVGNGTMMTLSRAKGLSAQRNSGGHIRVYAHLDVPLDWHVDTVDLDDDAAVRDYLLGVFDGWHEDLLGLLRENDGEFVNRPLYDLPIGHSWAHAPGITLLGDAAHLMPPFGVGANLAMLDGTDLADALATHTNVDDAVRAYESVMLPRSAAAAQACADLMESMNDEAPVDVDAIRRHLNDRILNPQA